MSLTDRLLSGKPPTLRQLTDDLLMAERDIDSLRAEVRHLTRSLDLAMALLDATAATLHLGHEGQIRTCLRGTCVEMRRSRAQVKP